MFVLDALKRAIDVHEGVEGTFLGQDCLALLAKQQQAYSAAVSHREIQLRMLDEVAQEARKLHRTARSLAARVVANDRSTVLAFLALSLWTLRDLDSAIARLSEMKQVCAKNGLTFGGGAVLQQLLRERTRPVGERHAPDRKARRQLIVAQAA